MQYVFLHPERKKNVVVDAIDALLELVRH